MRRIRRDGRRTALLRKSFGGIVDSFENHRPGRVCGDVKWRKTGDY
jgi:hypothetical protein